MEEEKRARGEFMRQKAHDTAMQARTLRDAKQVTGAASRGYYALHQAVSALLHEKGKRPTDYGADPDAKGFPHRPMFRHLQRDLGMDPDAVAFLRLAYALRLKADYFPEPIETAEFRDVFDELPAALNALRVMVEL